MNGRENVYLDNYFKSGGNDRYKQATEMEHKYAKYWASREGRSLKRITKQAHDGGRDFVGNKNGNKVIGEVKHWGRPVDSYTLTKYIEVSDQENADLVIAATKGLTRPAKKKAKEHGVEVITGNDLTKKVGNHAYSSLIRVIKSLFQKNLQIANTLKEHLISEVVTASRWVADVMREIIIRGILVAAWKRWKRLPLRRKIIYGLVFLLISALIYYEFKDYQNNDQSEGFFDWLSANLRI